MTWKKASYSACILVFEEVEVEDDDDENEEDDWDRCNCNGLPSGNGKLSNPVAKSRRNGRRVCSSGFPGGHMACKTEVGIRIG